MADDDRPSVLDRAVDLVARGMDALGLNGTRLRWRWNRRRREIGETGLRAEMFVRSARTPVKMCPACRALVPRAAWSCPECGAGLSRVRAPGLGRAVANLIPGATAATAAILFANAALFAAMVVLPPAVPGVELPEGLARLWAFDGYTLLRYGSGIPILTFGAGEWWRMITPLFLHAGLLHFALNSWALVSLGPLAEEEYGTERFAVIYVASGLAGTIVAQGLGAVRTVGASGAICGLLGLLLVHGWRRGGAYGNSLRNAMLQNTVLMLVISFGGSAFIDWRSHLGGFLAGALFGLVVPAGAVRRRAVATAWSVAAVATVGLVLLAFLLMASRGAETLRIILESLPR